MLEQHFSHICSYHCWPCLFYSVCRPNIFIRFRLCGLLCTQLKFHVSRFKSSVDGCRGTYPHSPIESIVIARQPNDFDFSITICGNGSYFFSFSGIRTKQTLVRSSTAAVFLVNIATGVNVYFISKGWFFGVNYFLASDFLPFDGIEIENGHKTSVFEETKPRPLTKILRKYEMCLIPAYALSWCWYRSFLEIWATAVIFSYTLPQPMNFSWENEKLQQKPIHITTGTMETTTFPQQAFFHTSLPKMGPVLDIHSTYQWIQTF